MTALPLQKDTTMTKIFVGGLPYHTTDESLKNFFEQFGEIEEAVVITDRQSAKSRGYGFVTMVDKAAAERACKDPNPIIDGRKANVNLAYLGAKPRGTTMVDATEPLSLPFLKTMPGLIPGGYGGYPYVFAPTAGLMAAQGGAGGLLPLTNAHTNMTQTMSGATGHMLDYTTAAAFPNSAAAGQQLAAAALTGSYMDMANYANATAAGYMHPSALPLANAANYYGMPQPLGLAATATQPAHLQQSLQERL